MNKLEIYDFIIHFIIGGLIVGVINFLSKYGKTKRLALRKIAIEHWRKSETPLWVKILQ